MIGAQRNEDRRKDRPALRAWRMAVMALLLVSLGLAGWSYRRLSVRVDALNADVREIRAQYVTLAEYVKETTRLKSELHDLRDQVEKSRIQAQRKFGK